MNKKVMFGIIIVLVIIMIVIYVIFNLNTNLMARSPYIEFEATIISVSLNDKVLEDSAVIKIDRIIETGGSYDFDWSSIGIEEGKEVPLDFKYSLGPAKIRKVVGETTQDRDTVSHTMVKPSVTTEGDYLVFIENGNSEREIILPGLEEGSKFRAVLSKSSLDMYGKRIGEYEVIS